MERTIVEKLMTSMTMSPLRRYMAEAQTAESITFPTMSSTPSMKLGKLFRLCTNISSESGALPLRLA